MKVLVAIPADKPAEMEGALAWASRAGFDVRVFIPAKGSLAKYQAKVEQINYDHYLDVRYDMLLPGINPLKYAIAGGYDVLVVVPPGLKRWNANKNRDEMIIEFHADIAKVRRRFGEDIKTHEVKFENGTRAVRVVAI